MAHKYSESSVKPTNGLQMDCAPLGCALQEKVPQSKASGRGNDSQTHEQVWVGIRTMWGGWPIRFMRIWATGIGLIFDHDCHGVPFLKNARHLWVSRMI
jgi:hypothetical protein